MIGDGLLASGGGSGDKSIKIWDIKSLLLESSSFCNNKEIITLKGHTQRRMSIDNIGR